MSTLKESEIEDFWLRCFFNPSTSLKVAAVDRAYRDFNRTLHKISHVQSQEKHARAKSLMISYINDVCNNDFTCQIDYDNWHKERCEELKLIYAQVFNFNLHIGQAQKWINMTFKYLFALGEKRIKGISRNYVYFHIPIDNIIQNMLIPMGIDKITGSWSRINDYTVYLNYQQLIRTKFFDQIPLDVEFRLFNGDISCW